MILSRQKIIFLISVYYPKHLTFQNREIIYQLISSLTLMMFSLGNFFFKWLFLSFVIKVALKNKITKITLFILKI